MQDIYWLDFVNLTHLEEETSVQELLASYRAVDMSLGALSYLKTDVGRPSPWLVAPYLGWWFWDDALG